MPRQCRMPRFIRWSRGAISRPRDWDRSLKFVNPLSTPGLIHLVRRLVTGATLTPRPRRLKPVAAGGRSLGWEPCPLLSRSGGMRQPGRNNPRLVAPRRRKARGEMICTQQFAREGRDRWLVTRVDIRFRRPWYGHPRTGRCRSISRTPSSHASLPNEWYEGTRSVSDGVGDH